MRNLHPTSWPICFSFPPPVKSLRHQAECQSTKYSERLKYSTGRSLSRNSLPDRSVLLTEAKHKARKAPLIAGKRSIERRSNIIVDVMEILMVCGVERENPDSNLSIVLDTHTREEQDHVEVSPFEARLPLRSPKAVSLKVKLHIERKEGTTCPLFIPSSAALPPVRRTGLQTQDASGSKGNTTHALLARCEW